jgi:hypothetical protein
MLGRRETTSSECTFHSSDGGKKKAQDALFSAMDLPVTVRFGAAWNVFAQALFLWLSISSVRC